MYCQLQRLFLLRSPFFALSNDFSGTDAVKYLLHPGAYECVNVCLSQKGVSKSSQRGITQRNNGGPLEHMVTDWLQSVLGIITSHGKLLVGMNLGK